MRIGIVTLPLHTNYGGILQAYALQTVLERMGHEVRVIKVNSNKIRKPLWYRYLRYLKRFVEKYLFEKNILVKDDEYYAEVDRVANRFTNLFIQEYIHECHVKDFKSIKESDFDAYVVGSDQIWRCMYFKQMTLASMADAFLRFTQGWNVKRIAYAPSFGTDTWEYNTKETDECGNMLRMFDAVSIRELNGVRLCKEYFSVNSEHVLDPTMLLQIADYKKIIVQSNMPKSKGNLHQYILDMTIEKRQLVDYIAMECSLVPFSVQMNRVEGMPIEKMIQPPVEQWLRAFYDAEYVVTDSFHACVFSILFRKQFVVVGNAKRGLSRFHSLLSQFGLEDRLVSDLSQYKSLKWIDYDNVYKTLNDKRESSQKFLINALNE